MMTDDTKQIDVISGNDGALGFITVSGGNGKLWLSYSVHANPDNNNEWRSECIGMTAADALRLAAELTAAATAKEGQ